MKLKPCPFCGGVARWANDDENWIECSYCGVETRFFDDTQEAIEVWNRRKPLEEIVEQLEEQKIMCGEIVTEAIEMNDLDLQFGARNQVVAFEKAIEIVKGACDGQSIT